MVIKFQEKNRWVIFGEIDHVEYERLGNGMSGKIDGEIICYQPPNHKDHSECGYYELSFFTKNMNEATVIRAFAPIYLMNDQGRTVETI